MNFQEMKSVLSARHPVAPIGGTKNLLQEMRDELAFLEDAWHGRLQEECRLESAREKLFGYISRALRLAQAVTVEEASVDEYLQAWPLSQEQFKHEVIDYIKALSGVTVCVGDILADAPIEYAGNEEVQPHLLQAIHLATLIAGNLQMSSSSFEVWLRPAEQAAA